MCSVGFIMVGISCFIIQRDVMRIKWIKAHRELRTGTERILYICIYLSIYIFIYYSPCNFVGPPHDSAIKNLLANAGDMGSTPGSARSHGEGNGNPLQYSCLGNLVHWGAWWAIDQWGHKRVGHDLAIEQQHLCCYFKSRGALLIFRLSLLTISVFPAPYAHFLGQL